MLHLSFDIDGTLCPEKHLGSLEDFTPNYAASLPVIVKGLYKFFRAYINKGHIIQFVTARDGNRVNKLYGNPEFWRQRPRPYYPWEKDLGLSVNLEGTTNWWIQRYLRLSPSEFTLTCGVQTSKRAIWLPLAGVDLHLDDKIQACYGEWGGWGKELRAVSSLKTPIDRFLAFDSLIPHVANKATQGA